MSLYYKSLNAHMRKYRSDDKLRESLALLHNENLKEELEKNNASFNQAAAQVRREQLKEMLYSELHPEAKRKHLEREAEKKVLLQRAETEYLKKLSKANSTRSMKTQTTRIPTRSMKAQTDVETKPAAIPLKAVPAIEVEEHKLSPNKQIFDYQLTPDELTFLKDNSTKINQLKDFVKLHGLKLKEDSNPINYRNSIRNLIEYTARPVTQ